MANILFFSPPFVEGFTRNARWAARSRARVHRHPDYILTTAAHIRKAGHTVDYLEANAVERLSEEQILRQAQVFAPEILVILATTPSIYNDIEWASKVKNATGCKVLLVGQHVSAVPEDTLSIAPDTIDWLALGEYDSQTLSLADGVEPADIPGLAFLENGSYTHTGRPEPIDVDLLPIPAWDLIDPYWYTAFGKRNPFLTLISGRGCNNLCSFCRDPQIMYGRKLRLRDPNAVVDEIEYDLKLFPDLQEIMFETDTFTASPRHVTKVCDEILRRDIKLSFSANARVDCKPEIMPIMKKAGFRWLNVGFEFGTDEQLKAVNKGTTIDMARRFAEGARKAGLKVHGCFIIGAPGETRESALKTIEFAKSIPLDTVQFTGITVYPGTSMYDEASDKGLLKTKDWTEWVSETREQTTNLRYENLTIEEINELVDQGLSEFYMRPRQMLRMLFGIRTYSDLRSKLRGFVKYMDYKRSR